MIGGGRVGMAQIVLNRYKLSTRHMFTAIAVHLSSMQTLSFDFTKS